MSLEKQFGEAMMNIYRRAKIECGYTPSIFHNMLVQQGGLVTAKKLINAKTESEGYTRLFMEKRLDLTVEAVVYENAKWHPLFESEELERCKTRLSAYGYVFKGDHHVT